MTSLRKFSIVLLVVAALAGLMAAPAQAQQVMLNCTMAATAMVGVSYNGQCLAQGGTAPYTFTFTGQVPPSLTNVAVTGNEYLVQGTPSQAGSYTFTLQAKDSIGGTSSVQSFTITVTGSGGASFSLSSVGTPSTVTPGTSVELILNGTGLTSNMSVFFAGTSYSPSSATSSQIVVNSVFVPSNATGSVTVYVTLNGTNSNQLTIGVSGSTGGLSISCSPSTGPTAFNTFFSQSCSVSGGTGSYNAWNVINLPTGISFSSNGNALTISGTPSVNGQSYTYTINISDTSGHTGQLSISGTIGTSNSGYNITQLIPATVAAGSLATQMIVVGNGFTQNSVVIFNGTPLTPTSIPTNVQVNSTIPANLLTTAGNYNVQVSTGGSLTNALPFTVTSGGGTPGGGGVTLTSLSPASEPVGSAAFQLTIFGSGFSNGALITFGSCNVSGNVSTAGQITATIPANCLTTAANVNVTVGGSNALQFTIGGGGSTGSLTISCNPSAGPSLINTAYNQTCTVSGGTSPYTWSITGTLPSGLSQNAPTGTGNNTETISGTPNLAQTYSYTYNVTDSSSSRLTGTLPISGTIGSSTYNITQLSQTTVAVNSSGINLTVYGNGFTNASAIAFNGGQLPTTYVSNTQLSANIPSSYLTTNETASITVITNGTSTNALQLIVGSGGGGAGGTLSLVCSPGVGPSIANTSYTIACTVSGGSGNYTWTAPGLGNLLTLPASNTGSSFTLTGTPSGSTYNFTINVTDTSSPPQTASLQIAGQVGTSAGNSGVILTSLSPTAVALNTSGFTLTINGSGFNSTSQVVFDGIPVTTTAVSGSQLTAAIPVGLLSFARSALVTVVTGGIPSNGLSFTVGTGGQVQISINCSPGVGPSAPNTFSTSNCVVNGGNGPYQWSISAGSLPTGLTLTSNGPSATINGYSTLNGKYSYTLQVTDSSSHSTSVVFAGETGAGSTTTSGVSISSLSPPSTAVGSAAVNLTVNGSGFVSGAVVYFNGAALQTNYVSSSQLTATIPATSLTQQQTVSVYVLSSGAQSNSVTFTVGTVATTGISISCNPAVGPSTVGGNYTTTCTASGGKAPFTWTVQGIPVGAGLALTNSTTNTVSVVGTLGSNFSNYNYTVMVADSSSPAVTGSYPFVGYVPPSTSEIISNMSPVSVPAGSGAVTLTVTGSGFVSGVTSLLFGSTSLPATVSGNTLTATVPANLLTSPGTVNVQISPGNVSNFVGFFITAGSASGGVSPASLTFTYGIGGTLPAAQTVSVTSISGATAFNVVPIGSANNTNWLVVSPSSGAIPGTVSVSISPGTLPIGSYTGSLTVSGIGVGSAGSVTIPVTLNVVGAPVLTGTPGSVNLTSSPGGTTSQTVQVTSSDNTTVFSYTTKVFTNNGGNWLSVSPASGNTPSSITITAAGGSLAPSTYSGSVILTTSNNIQTTIPVGLAITAPPNISANPTSLSFSALAGQSNPAAQTISVSASNNGGVNYTTSVATQSGGNWLSAAASGTTPGSISVTVNISGLTSATYNGSVTINAPGAVNNPITVPVTLTVASAPSLTASPSTLSFNSAGGAIPPSQSITVSAPSGGTIAFNITAATSTGGNWLSATPTSGTTPTTVQVNVSAAGLAPGTYNGTLTVTGSGVGPATVAVSLTVAAAAPTLAISPITMTFTAPVGATTPPQTVMVTTTNSVVATYNVTASSSGNWLSASPTSGTTPGTVTVSVNPGSLAIGQYTGSVTIIAVGGTNNPQTVQVTLNITSPSSIGTVPGSLSFFVPGDGSTPAPQSLTVFSTGSNVSFTSSATSQGGNWLTATGSGTTPGNIMVTVNPAGLTGGLSYNGVVNISAPGSTPSSLQIPVTLTLAQTGTLPLQIAPSAVYLSYAQGAGSDLQHVVVLNIGGGNVSFTAQSTTANCGSWLNVITPTGSAAASSPAIVAFTVNPTGLTSQTCRGSIGILDANANAVTVPVYMAISGQSQSVLLSQTAMNFTAASGGAAPAAQAFQILNPGSGSLPWSITTKVLSGGSWLTVAPNSGSSQGLAQAGSPINVSVNPQGLAAGTYYGTVQVTSSGALNTPQSITVSFTVLAAGMNPPEQVTPSGVIINGNNSTDSQTVTLSNLGSGSVTFASTLITDDGQNWLVATPASGSVTAGGTSSISLTANLNGVTSGLRHGTMVIIFSDGNAQTVDVQLILSGAGTGAGVRPCTSSNLAMEFLTPAQNFAAVASVAVPLQVLVKDCNGNTLTNSSAGVDVLAGSSDIRLNYTGSGIWAGSWTPAAANPVATLTARSVSISGGSTASGVIAANGSTGTAQPGAAPNVTAVVNAGSFLLPGLVAPGTMVSIFGSGLADSQTQVSSTPFPNTLAGSQFTLRGLPLPLFYASDGQVNAIIPAGLSADERDQLIVVRDTTQSAPVDLLVADVDPGIFATNQQGTGQGAILVGGTAQLAAPTGTVPGAGPATAGQVVSIFIAGLGTVSNPPPDGSPSSSANPSTTPTNPIVTIGGTQASVQYSGLAPGEVGLYQVNVQVPTGVTTGNAVPVVITMGNGISNTVTMAIQ